MEYNIKSFGAIADGVTLNTAAIQAAIDECSSAGGGKVVIPSGTYKCGTIWLKPNVELHLELGAHLLASDNMDDYNDLDAYEQNRSCAVEEWVGKHLIIALEIENSAITGLGTIDGNCHAFVDRFTDYPQYHNGYIWSGGMSQLKDKERQRPGQLICFIECKNVTVQDITIKDSPCWSLYFLGSEYVRVRGIKVSNPSWMLNSDGIDIDASRYVTVSDCIIHTGDDAITLRACENQLKNKNMRCEYVTITNCVLNTSICAFRIGVGLGSISHARISNVVIERCCNAIQLCTSYSNKGKVNIDDVNFSGISAYNTDRLIEAFSRNGASIKNITVENVRSTSSMQNYFDAEDGSAENIELRNTEIYMFDKFTSMTPALLAERGNSPLLLKKVDGVRFENVKIHGNLCQASGVVSDGCSEVYTDKCNFEF